MSKTKMNSKPIAVFRNGLIPFLNSKRNRDWSQSGNVHMFHEDISQHKMPYSDRLQKHPNFKVTIHGSGADQAREILCCLSQYHRSERTIGPFKTRYSDTEIVCDVINNISRSIYYFGRILVCRRTTQEGSTEFVKIYPQNIIKLLQVYLQFIPKADRNEAEAWFRIENRRNAFSLSLFLKPFSRIKFCFVSFLLSRTDGVFPRFVSEDRFQNKHFITNDYKLLELQFMSLLTKSYAWKLRFSADEYTNEYAKIHAAYRSAIHDATNREVLVDQINTMFDHFNIEASISIDGIPSSKDLKESIILLERGQKTFRQALDDVYLN